nr:MAG TPA: hypothetical protein [Caudoviricetes sp.]
MGYKPVWKTVVIGIGSASPSKIKTARRQSHSERTSEARMCGGIKHR